MSGALSGKVALVSGAARGIGRAIALKLASAGCDVAANYYNSADEAEALCGEIRALGRRAVAIQASVGIPASVDELFAEFGKHFDRIDIIVSNAASGVLKPTTEMTLKHWRWCMETNALALNLLTQRALPLMKDGGRIVALSSLGSVRAMPGYGFIGASKAALEALARALAQELGPRGIRVNTVSAGVVDTDALAYFPNRDEVLANYAARTPAGPVLTPQDVADAVYLLCLPEANMINGHTLVVDGGFAISRMSASSPSGIEGKVAIVTGGSRGIGRAIVERLAADGADVTFFYRGNAAAAEEVLAAARTAGWSVAAEQLDIRDSAACAAAVERIADRAGRIDILVNNAGITRDNPLAAFDDADVNEVLATNVGGVFAMCRAVVPYMTSQRAGAIVNLSSVAGDKGGRGQTNYAASKGAINAFTRALAVELAPRKVRVNAVAPGVIDTEMSAEVRELAGDAVLQRILLRRWGRPEEVADAVWFLVSSHASYMTGQVLAVDGGFKME